MVVTGRGTALTLVGTTGGITAGLTTPGGGWVSGKGGMGGITGAAMDSVGTTIGIEASPPQLAVPK